MGIFDSILWGDKNISLWTSGSSGTSWGQNDNTTGQSTEKKIVPVIEEMTLIDTSLGEESDLPKATETTIVEPVQEVASFNESQSIDIGGSANVITETTSIVGNNPIVDVTTTTPSSNTPTEIDKTLFAGTSIDLAPEPEKVFDPLPGQDAWSEESSIHSHGNTEGLLANPLPMGETGEVDAPDIFGSIVSTEKNGEPVVIEESVAIEETPAIKESPDSEVSSNLFGWFDEEASPEPETIQAVEETPVEEFSIIENPIVSPEKTETLSLSEESPVVEKENQDIWIMNPFHFEPNTVAVQEEASNDSKIETPLFWIIEKKSMPNILPDIKNPEENPKDILKNTIEQLKDLRSSKNQLLKETKKQAEDYKESARKMHDNEVKTRLLIKDIEAEIVRIGELIDVCYIQMKEGSEKKVIPPAQKRIKGKLVKTQNKNIKKATV